jgi:hypothetical protein
MALRIGIIGCGKIAGNHARALQRVPGIEVVGCCDPDLDRARTFAAAQGIPHSRVLDAHDRPIGGLSAVGVDQASVMGGHYPSGGINLGPAMTFGYLAGRRLAAKTGTP